MSSFLFSRFVWCRTGLTSPPTDQPIIVDPSKETARFLKVMEAATETSETQVSAATEMSPEMDPKPSPEVNGSAVAFADLPMSKLVPPRQRASMLPKPEIGPKPSFLRGSPVKRQLPVASGPPSLNIMSTSLPSPFATSPSVSDSAESSR